jgi:hypothetical protein
MLRKEVKRMKIVSLCGQDSCCPVVKIDDEHVEIGEKDNLCVLTKSEWEVLREKILDKEI